MQVHGREVGFRFTVGTSAKISDLCPDGDISRLGFIPGQQVDLLSLWDDNIERKVCGFTLLAYDTPAGQAAAYYPETNPLVPLGSVGEGSYTPTSKFIAIRLLASAASNKVAALNLG